MYFITTVLKDPVRNDIRDYHNPEAAYFVTQMFEVFSQEENKKRRKEIREQLTNEIKTREMTSHRVKLFAFDVDHTMGLLYNLSTTTAWWSLQELSFKHGIRPVKALFDVAKQIEPEYICHDIDAFMNQVAEVSGRPELKPDNPDNAEIMEDWRNMRDSLNKHFLFRDILPTFREIKKQGGLIYLATIAPKASVMQRLFLWGGEEMYTLIDGIAVRPDLDGMSANNPWASDKEREFVRQFEKEDKITIIPEHQIKPSGYHLLWCINHANEKAKVLNEEPIKPEEVVMVGDSLGTDANTAYDLLEIVGHPAHFAWPPKGIVDEPYLVEMHNELIGNKKDILGVDVVLKKIRSGNYRRPSVVLKCGVRDLFRFFKIVPAYGKTSLTPEIAKRQSPKEKVMVCDR